MCIHLKGPIAPYSSSSNLLLPKTYLNFFIVYKVWSHKKRKHKFPRVSHKVGAPCKGHHNRFTILPDESTSPASPPPWEPSSSSWRPSPARESRWSTGSGHFARRGLKEIEFNWFHIYTHRLPIIFNSISVHFILAINCRHESANYARRVDTLTLTPPCTNAGKQSWMGFLALLV